MSYILLTCLLAPLWWPLAVFRRFINRTPQRIVIFEIAGIGDVVCSTHLFAQLRVRYPNAVIDLIVDPIAASMVSVLPMTNRVIQFPYARQRGFMGRLRLAKCCIGYDTAVCLIPSAAQLIGFCLAAVPRRLSVLPAPLNTSYRILRPLLSDVALHHAGQYFLQTQASLFESLGVTNIDAAKWIPAPDYQDHSNVPRLNETINIGVLVSSGRVLKRIGPDKLVAVIEQLLESSTTVPVKIVLIGGPGDGTLAQTIMAQFSDSQRTQIVDAVGYYTLGELPALLKQLSVLIGVDSGVTHMADALAVPVVCVAGPVDLDEVYQPGEMRVLVHSDLPCYPCSFVFDTPSTCHTNTLGCLKQLNVKAIVHAAKTIIDSVPYSPQ